MKDKIAKKIVNMAEKTAYRTVGKSFPMGTFEIKPPIQLMQQRKCNK